MSSEMRLFAVVLALAVSNALADTVVGQVTAVTGGDTLMVVDARSHVSFTVQLQGIQAPGLGHAFGSQARQHLSALTFGRTVTVEAETSGSAGHLAGQVFSAAVDCQSPQCPRRIDVGLEQINAGLAWWARHRAGNLAPTERQRYEEAEFRAKTHRNGLWSKRDTLPPWLPHPVARIPASRL